MTQTLELSSFSNSYLEFRFTKNESGDYYKRFLPFIFGDPVISESRKANYINYNPISRNTQIPFYTGSDSRIFKIAYTINTSLLQSAKKDIFSIIKQIKTLPNSVDGTLGDNNEKQKFSIVSGPNNSNSDIGNRIGGIKKIGEVAKQTSNDDQVIFVEYADYQINLIRSAVINNAQKPTYGPPIIRLNYGLLYQNIPCICTDYSIEHPTANDNIRNMAPLSKLNLFKIVINFTLQEVRNGDFLYSKFDYKNSISQDNIVGWEQIIETGHGSLDPITPIYKD
jgi:hypothetical protein